MAMALTCPHLQRSNIQRVVGYMLMRHVNMSHQLLCRMSTVVGEGQSFICACRDAAERECRVSNPNPNPVFYYFFIIQFSCLATRERYVQSHVCSIGNSFDFVCTRNIINPSRNCAIHNVTIVTFD